MKDTTPNIGKKKLAKDHLERYSDYDRGFNDGKEELDMLKERIAHQEERARPQHDYEGIANLKQEQIDSLNKEIKQLKKNAKGYEAARKEKHTMTRDHIMELKKELEDYKKATVSNDELILLLKKILLG
tara:strand:- start:187 stop:573 length:387 start_codon:yes stop_codon:yes gene_type:complete